MAFRSLHPGSAHGRQAEARRNDNARLAEWQPYVRHFIDRVPANLVGLGHERRTDIRVLCWPCHHRHHR